MMALRVDHMGLNAEILAVGPFSSEVQLVLEFPECYYETTAEGTTVVRFLFGAEFTSAVTELEACIGQKHGRFDPFQVDLPRFRAFADTYLLRSYGDDLAAFSLLRGAGFDF